MGGQRWVQGYQASIQQWAAMETVEETRTEAQHPNSLWGLVCNLWTTDNIYKRVCRDRFVFRASARYRVRLMLETTPRFRLSWASERDSATPRQTCPKSRSESWQPRTDSSRTLSSFRLSQMSWTSAADSSSPVIWMEAGSILGGVEHLN